MPDCARTFTASGTNPREPKKGDVLVFNINDPIVFPCHEKVTVIQGADLQQESGNSFQIRMTADYAVLEVLIWCNAIVGDGEGARVCERPYPIVIGQKQFVDRFVECFRKCWRDKAPQGQGQVAFVIASGGVGLLIGAAAGAFFGGPLGAGLGASAGAGVGAVGGLGIIAAGCAIKCFFASL